jgi:hypothetical protein
MPGVAWYLNYNFTKRTLQTQHINHHSSANPIIRPQAPHSPQLQEYEKDGIHKHPPLRRRNNPRPPLQLRRRLVSPSSHTPTPHPTPFHIHTTPTLTSSQPTQSHTHIYIYKTNNHNSQIRQIPDHQEVYLDNSGYTSIVIEILQYVSKPSDEEALQYHFSDVIEGTGDSTTLLAQEPASMKNLP